MAFLIDEAFLPATLTAPPMSDEEFAAFCAEHPDLFFEVSADGELIVRPPTFSFTGARNNQIGRQLGAWAEQDGRGIACDSSTGFVLPNGARRSPDAAWILRSRVQQLAPDQQRGYWHLCPDFVIELRSESDRLRPLRKKMDEWLASGAQLGWLIDPDTRTVEIYRPGHEPRVVAGLSEVTGEAPVSGFSLNLVRVWDPLGA